MILFTMYPLYIGYGEFWKIPSLKIDLMRMTLLFFILYSFNLILFSWTFVILIFIIRYFVMTVVSKEYAWYLLYCTDINKM